MNGKHALMEYRVNLLKTLVNPARLEIPDKLILDKFSSFAKAVKVLKAKG